jgi:transcriptional regulator with XRE-family HTH domain
MKSFGKTIREARMQAEITLRAFAKMIGVSPTYISQIERDEYAPPSESRIKKIAEVLNLDADELSALAQKTPPDLEKVFYEKPKEIAAFLRTAQKLSNEQIRELTTGAKRFLKDEK